ncbi:MAG: aminoacyl-tRNA hydrolase [Burkholderiales bacterium]|nr:aminoacyl-tRNA hydrolase [Burkholderiales bacterium]
MSKGSTEPPIRLIVGLGNPGPDYANTRHNAGAWFVQAVADQMRCRLQLEKGFLGETGRFKTPHGDVWCLIPATYMNRSGLSVAALAKFYKIAPEEILVAHDELDLLPGTVKLKFGGGSAGHNGLKDITSQMSSPNFWRLRLGIGHPRTLQLTQQVADFVLHRPRQEELRGIEDCIFKSLTVLPSLLEGNFALASKELHTQTPGSGKPITPP